MNSISLSRLAATHPVCQKRVPSLVTQWEARFPGFHLEISQGVRSWNEQNAYWLQGRQPTAAVNAARQAVGLAPITDAQNVRVSDAAPGQSNHNYGFAVDFVVESDAGVLDWNAGDDRWAAIVSLAPSCGLRSGACWGDRPHVELEEVPEDPTAEMIQILKNQGMEAVWKEFPQLDTQ